MPTKEWRRPVCGTKQGQLHIVNGMECQDYVNVCDSGDYTVAALADGVGSRALSRVAAVEAVKGTIYWFMSNAEYLGDKEHHEDGVHKIKNALLPMLRTRIEQRARENGQDIRNMDCNLAFVFIRKNPHGEDRAYFGVLGDCAVCLVGSDDSMHTLCGAQPGTNATDSVMYLPSERNFKVYHRYVEGDDVRGFLLTSDGLEYQAYVKRSPYVYHGAQDYYNAIFAPNPEHEIQQLFQRLQQDAFFDDDLSVAVLSRDDEPRTFRKDPYWLCQCGQKNNIHNLRCSNCKTEFVSLYKNLPQEYEKKGVKNKFEYFLHLNQNPKEEYSAIGLAPGTEKLPKETPKRLAVSVSPEPVKTEKPKKEQEKSEVTGKGQKETKGETVSSGPKLNGRAHTDREMRKKKPEMKSLIQNILCGAAVVLILIDVLLSGMALANNRKTLEMKSVLSGQIQEIQESIRELSGSLKEPEVSAEQTESHMLQLADGSVYYGPLKNGVPNGYGILESEGSITSGEFINGKENGLFLIRSLEGSQELTVVTYSMGKIVDGPRKIGFLSGRMDMLTSVLLASELEVYEDHKAREDAAWIIPADTMIYLTGEYFCEKTGYGGKTELWLRICGPDEQFGWCRAADLDMFER